jgi:hypothetical protein
MDEAMADPWFKEYLKEREKEQVEGNYIVNSLLNMKKFR